MMQKIYFLFLVSLVCLNGFSQNVGIGTTLPKARLHIADSNVVFTGPATIPATTNFNPAIQGAGTRMMWYPQKAAFRVGAVTGMQWNKDSIGVYSFAAGLSNKAMGYAAVAMGDSTVASGDYSTALGLQTTASGEGSIAAGAWSSAAGLNSIAMGANSIASNSNSLAIGYADSAFGAHSIAIGLFNKTLSNFSIAIGTGNSANGYHSLAMGADNISGYNSTALGVGARAIGQSSIAIGDHTTASGYGSTAIGYYSTASATSSLAIGMGNVASGTASSAIGSGIIARSNNSFVIGKYNDTTASYSLFEIGMGTANTTRANAMTVLSNGAVGFGKANPSLKLEVTLANSGSSYHPNTSVGIESNNHHYINLITNNNSETGILFGNGMSYCDGGITYTPATGSPTPRVMNFRTANTTTMTLYGNGNLGISGSLFQNSDMNLKKNITPLSSSLLMIQQLQGYTYNWKDEKRDNAQQIGLLAQEVQKVYPGLVKENADGNLGVNYIGLVPVLIEGIKEQQRQIEELKAELKKLTRK